VLLKVAGGWEDEQDKEDGYNWANGILLVRRNIEPGFGELALPGGYVDMGENWQQASRRELFEETGVLTDADGYELYDVISTERSILLFTWNPRIEIDIRRIDMSLTNEETSELVFTREPVKLAFPAHTKVMHDFYTDQLDY
jgi:8-oxo-dGTP pyrophosphatase MutT (NUDIX family)